MAALSKILANKMRLAASLLLALSLSLGTLGDLAGMRSVAGAGLDAFGQAICHSEPDSQAQPAQSQGQAAAHGCCVYCHVAHAGDLILPAAVTIARLAPAGPVVYGGGRASSFIRWAQAPQQARAPPKV
jgi:hypothetical protein